MDLKRTFIAIAVTATLFGMVSQSDAQPRADSAVRSPSSPERPQNARGRLGDSQDSRTPSLSRQENAAREAVRRYLTRNTEHGLFVYSDPQTQEKVSLRFEGFEPGITKEGDSYALMVRFTEIGEKIAGQRFTDRGEGAAFALRFYAAEQDGGFRVVGFDR